MIFIVSLHKLQKRIDYNRLKRDYNITIFETIKSIIIDLIDFFMTFFLSQVFFIISVGYRTDIIRSFVLIIDYNRLFMKNFFLKFILDYNFSWLPN